MHVRSKSTSGQMHLSTQTLTEHQIAVKPKKLHIFPTNQKNIKWLGCKYHALVTTSFFLLSSASAVPRHSKVRCVQPRNGSWNMIAINSRRQCAAADCSIPVVYTLCVGSQQHHIPEGYTSGLQLPTLKMGMRLVETAK